MEAQTLEIGLKAIMHSYAVRGFSVGVIFLDIQFKCVKDRNQLGVLVNVVSKGEHVKLIERYHRLIEKRCRCDYAILPYDSSPRMMLIHFMIAVIFYANAFV